MSLVLHSFSGSWRSGSRTLLFILHNKVAPLFLAGWALHCIFIDLAHCFIIRSHFRECFFKVGIDLLVQSLVSRYTPKRTWSDEVLSHALSPADSSTSVHAQHIARQSASRFQANFALGLDQMCSSTCLRSSQIRSGLVVPGSFFRLLHWLLQDFERSPSSKRGRESRT